MNFDRGASLRSLFRPLDAVATSPREPEGRISQKKKRLCFSAKSFWLREADLNHRPSGYEPDELTGLLHPAIYKLVSA